MGVLIYRCFDSWDGESDRPLMDLEPMDLDQAYGLRSGWLTGCTRIFFRSRAADLRHHYRPQCSVYAYSLAFIALFTLFYCFSFICFAWFTAFSYLLSALFVAALFVPFQDW